MDVKGLMIGDWVNYSILNLNAKVFSILGNHTIGIQFIDKNNKVEAIHGLLEEVIRPIPLTEEILVKNGWDFRDRQYAIECEEDVQGIVELSRDKDGYYWSINWDEYQIIRIHYVHEMQHILRLCGIDKEIEL